MRDLIVTPCALRKDQRNSPPCDEKEGQMLTAHKAKSTSQPVYSARLDLPNCIYASSNPWNASREEQMLNFLNESIMLAKNAHHIENFTQNLYLHCPNTWGLAGICLREITSTHELSIVTQISNYDIPVAKCIRMTINSKNYEIEVIRFNVGIFFETRSALLNYSDEVREICNLCPHLQGLICLPISSNGEIWGTLEFLFEKEVTCDEGIQSFFTCVAQIVGIAIDQSSYMKQKKARQEILESEAESELAKIKLTPKLEKVAKLISNGKTNTEIARALSYSESAARYETVKLYAMLRVKNRAEAGAVISKMNLTQ
jgi:DNA-binding CsgD family transcriptional regulator